ncbi:hypothetical protein ABZP36_017323 [Zizania latifolia]
MASHGIEQEETATPSRSRCILRIKLPPAWTPEEDELLERLAVQNGFRRWRRVARDMPRHRSSRQCRDRWRDHLSRDDYHRPFTADDDAELARLCIRGGSGERWKDISRAVQCRTSRDMKRRWRELRKSDAFLRTLWRPRTPTQPPAEQEVGMHDDKDSSPAQGDVLISGEASGKPVAPGLTCLPI